MSKAFSVFVGNVPARIHWRWVKSLFSESLRVTDVFLTRYPGSNGTKFGFVRFRAPEEAVKAINLFNGFRVLRSNLRVAVAKERKAFQQASKLKSSWCAKRPFPICSAVESEGETSDSRLPEAERFIWVRCFGLPGKLWNRPTLENLASLWGKLILFTTDRDNNLNPNLYCFQIQTDHVYRIDDVITVKCGSHSYIVRIEECCECYVRGNFFNGEGPRIQSQLVTAKISNVDLENHASVQEVIQNADGNDPFGLESIINRLSDSRKKKSRKKVSNPLREESEKVNVLNCTALVSVNDAAVLDLAMLSVPSDSVNSELLKSTSCIEIQTREEGEMFEDRDIGIPGSASMVNDLDNESVGELPLYVEPTEIEGVVSQSLNAKRKMRFPDPRKSWELSKALGCISSLSDNAMVERNIFLDSMMA